MLLSLFLFLQYSVVISFAACITFAGRSLCLPDIFCNLRCISPLVCRIISGSPQCVPLIIPTPPCNLRCTYPQVCQIIQGTPYCVPPVCGANEEIRICGAWCENTCRSLCQVIEFFISRTIQATTCPRLCGPPACACKPLYYRDQYGRCVPSYQCPACTPPPCNLFCSIDQKCYIVNGRPTCQQITTPKPCVCSPPYVCTHMPNGQPFCDFPQNVGRR